jgi:hypothetical protein
MAGLVDHGNGHRLTDRGNAGGLRCKDGYLSLLAVATGHTGHSDELSHAEHTLNGDMEEGYPDRDCHSPTRSVSAGYGLILGSSGHGAGPPWG